MQVNRIEDIQIEEIALSNLYVQKALINLLSEKGILTKRDILDEVKNQLNSHDKQGL
jgi:hypothetical protein